VGDDVRGSDRGLNHEDHLKKIISLFQRNYDGDRLVRDEVTPGCEWVAENQGIATRKYDGTCCLVRSGKLFKRYEVKPGGKPPPDFEPANEVDRSTGKTQGWVPVGDGPEDRWHREAFDLCPAPDGTYELCVPKVQGNPEGFEQHALVPHGDQNCPGCPRDFAGLRAFFAANDIEGIVWHHPDGRMVKLKRRDFGLPWPVTKR
jgi:hypothetical protein